MAMSGAIHRSTALKALTVFSLLAVAVADGCPRFTCGPLQHIGYPFRRRGDPPGCGLQSLELVCSDSKATIRIDNATYYITVNSHEYEPFWIVDAALDNSSCPLPRWSWHPQSYSRDGIGVGLAPATFWLATFVRCSQEIKNNGMYRLVACLSTNYSFVYVLTGRRHSTNYIENLEPSCGYLAMTPLGSWGLWDTEVLENASYADVIKFMRKGFAVRIPLSISECLTVPIRDLRAEQTTKDRILVLSFIDIYFWSCVLPGSRLPDGVYAIVLNAIVLLGWFVNRIAVLCRFVLVPLAVFTFLAHKCWKTRITIDAVEKFLRMQQMIGPTRYAYTDITAITSHFRDKLGQGGYGSVYKGVLLPGDVHVAVKMLGSSNCNGEDFISEVATIGRIHHVNVVRLMGFCSEETRRALVYEYMPRGSLDKYIFSSERSFSWDKLNEIALGIARGINYLHQGCDMQILHFDIKPHNILLDNNFVPKVADFGLAKLYPRDNSFVPSSALRGTVGYIAPEMISRSFGAISSKSDVYSFGMLLLEMAGGRRNADVNAANSSQAYYPSWVYSRLTRQDQMGEIARADNVVDMHELERKLCVIGLWCIQMKACDRPTMSEVIETLEGGADGLQVPPKPFFCEDEQFPAVESYRFSPESEQLTAISEEDE